ncbi:MAG TPA: PAS domain S-box protein, partial [Phycisphaerales bacterium]|nr:PAS domain S-box protein [Phycisphaerales bacterium]
MTAWTALIEHLPPVLDGLSLVAAVTAGVTLLATRCRVLSRSVRGATVGIVILLGLHSLGNILEYMGVTEALDYSEILLSALFFFVVFAFSQERVTNDLKEREQQLATANQQLRADEQQLQAANQQLRAANQQLQAGEQQLRAANQQLRAHEQQLRAANRRFRETNSMLKLVLDTIPVRVFWKDRQECYLGCNRLFAQDAGLEDPDQIRGKTDFDLPWKDQADLYRHDDAEVMATGRGRVNYEEPQTMPDGRRAILQTSKVPLRDDDGSVIGVLGTYEDVTEHKRAVEALRENERRLATLMSNLPGMAYRCKNDAEWTMEFVSEGCYPLTGYTSEELIGNARLSYGELIVPEDRQAVWDGIQSALERNQPFQLVYRITTADG